jgi:hypothetical protein
MEGGLEISELASQALVAIRDCSRL